MKRRISLALLVALMTGACSARTPETTRGPEAAEPASDPATWQGDARLYRALLAFPLGASQRDSLNAYELEHTTTMNLRLAEAGEDQRAPSVVRANALLLLAQRRAVDQLFVFRAALSDPNQRVRATATAAMREFLDVRPEAALSIARSALHDSVPEVQAQSLPIIGERDVPALRAYLTRAPNAELARITREIIAVSEERGAPLEGDSATGSLRRVTPHGFTVTFTPQRHWPQWQAAVGTVEIARPGQQPVRVDGIEVVGGVIPVFFSADGAMAVYERDRTIHVRDLRTGRDQSVGPGIAPRSLPFTQDFVFAREVAGARLEQREKTRIGYELLQLPFAGAFDAGATPKAIGTANATVSFGERGGFSPLRWMRLEERGGAFFLTADGMEMVTLPDPFKSGGGMQ